MGTENFERSLRAFNSLCAALDNRKFNYSSNRDELTISVSATGDDLPMKLDVRVIPEKEIILLLSHMPFVIPEDKRIDTAIATSIVNNRLIDGSFDFDFAGGHMFFRITSSFRESEVSADLFDFMLMSSFIIIDKYNDKFLMLSKGLITFEQFVED